MKKWRLGNKRGEDQFPDGCYLDQGISWEKIN